MDSVEFTIRLTYSEPLSNEEYEELCDRLRMMIEREASFGGEISLEESEVYESECEFHHGADNC